MHFHGNHSTCASSNASRFVLPGTKRRYERSRPFTLTHQALDVLLLLDSSSIEATATLQFRRVDKAATHLKLDAIGFEIDQVSLQQGDEEVATNYAYDGNVICIAVPPELNEAAVSIAYRVKPRRGLYFLRPDEAVPQRPNQVWSQCQDEDARFWFPCHDAPHMKLTSELLVTVPKHWIALSNGTCLSKEVDEEAGTASFHYRIDKPHPSYLVTLVAGEFAILEDRPAKLASGRAVPIRYYVPVGEEAKAWRSLGDTPNMVELFSRLTGLEYPFSEYSQITVSDFIFGGMENTTATTLYEHVLLDERAAIDVDSRSLVAHELAHQWFGDTLTCRDWSEAWLNEGFATYFEHVEREARLGRDEYEFGVLGDLESYVGEFAHSYDRPIVCQDYQAPIDLFDRHLYEKGGLVLHMLRRRLTTEIFWSAIREYVRENENGVVETNLFKRVCERVSGQSLERFFDDWVYRSGHPELTVEATYEARHLVVTVKQEVKGDRTTPFAFDFEIQVRTAEGTLLSRRIEVDDLQASLTIELAERPAYVAFDPELRITSPVKLQFGFDWLRNLLKSDATLRARILAAQALAKRHDVPTITALSDVLLDREVTYLLRLECARALAKIPTLEAREALTAAVQSERAEVRRAVAQGLGQFRTPEVIEPLTSLATTDPSYLVQAEACRAMGNSRQTTVKTVLEGRLGVSSWADVVSAGAADGLATLRLEESLPRLREKTRYGQPTRGRRVAISALGRVATDRVTRDHLEQLLGDPDPHVRADVVGALEAMGLPEATAALSQQQQRELDPRVQRRLREAIRELGAKEPEASKRLTDELAQVKNQLSEVEAKIARLVALSAAAAPGAEAADVASGKGSTTKKGRRGAPANKALRKTTEGGARATASRKPGTDAAAKKPKKSPAKAKAVTAARKTQAVAAARKTQAVTAARKTQGGRKPKR